MKRKFATLFVYVAISLLSVLVGLVFFGPIIAWNNMPQTPLNIWIVDKTVPIPEYREHKGLMWALNHNKVTNEKTGKPFQYETDYFGFFPLTRDEYDLKDIPDIKENPDLIYLTDTYGVYTDDYMFPNVQGTNSELLYGGLEHEELRKITNNIGNGNTLIGEFNIASSPTNIGNQEELELLFGVKWSGWKGRYFEDLKRDIEVPILMVENYEKQESVNWDFKGSGYVLISEKDQIVVLENDKHIGAQRLTIKFEEAYMSEFHVDKDIPYHYWFEFLQVNTGTETIANYHLDLTSEGEEVLKGLGLSGVFPAVARKANSEYTAYYFGGDYADFEGVNKSWNYYGLQNIKKVTSSFNKSSPDYFYWNAYVPMMRTIIGDLEGKKEQDAQVQNARMPYISKVEGKDFYIYHDGYCIIKLQ